MLMLDYDYNHTVFDFDAAFYSDQLKAENWRAWFSLEALGPNIMAVFIDIYGNKSQVLIPRDAFQPVPDESAELSPVTHQSN